MKSMNYEVILYYNFEPIADPEAFCKDHKRELKNLGLKGRVYIGKEGINGTLGGTPNRFNSIKNTYGASGGLKIPSSKRTEMIPCHLQN